MIIHDALLCLLEASSSEVKSTELTGQVIILPRLVNFKDQFTHSFLLASQACSSAGLIFQATWVNQVKNSLFSSTNWECGIPSSGLIVTSEVQSVNPGFSLRKFKM
jgi:hypothetical protein